jgi:hypothetical protein
MWRLMRATAGNILVQIVLLATIITRCSAATQFVVMAQTQPQSQFWKDITVTLSPVLTAVVGFLALWISVKNVNKQIVSSEANANAQRWRDANQKEIEQLEGILNNFHVPYLVRSEANNNVAQDLRDRFNDPKYRLLSKLFDPTWLKNLSVGDQALINEVCEVGSELRKFIEQYGGCVDSTLVDHLARAATHFRILSLAKEGKLGADPSPFARYVYPRQLDDALKVDRDRIVARLRLLRANPSENHGIIEPLQLPKKAQLDPWPNPLRPNVEAESSLPPV